MNVTVLLIDKCRTQDALKVCQSNVIFLPPLIYRGAYKQNVFTFQRKEIFIAFCSKIFKNVLPLKSKKEKQVFILSRCVYVVSLSRNLRIGVISRYILVQQWFTFYIMISHLSRIGTHTHRVQWSTCNGGNWISSRFCVRIRQYQIERSKILQKSKLIRHFQTHSFSFSCLFKMIMWFK